MYIPEHFKVDDQAEIHAFIEANAFGQVVSQVEGRPYSTHVPFLLSEDKKSLICHVARQNPQWRDIEGQEALVTLQGPHAYISPSWYESAGVPTWNYQAVHIYGQCRVFNDSDRLKDLVDALTRQYESKLESPWVPEYSAKMLGAIVGIEMLISQVQCKFKLSQNRSAGDRENVIERLEEMNSAPLADAMGKIS